MPRKEATNPVPPPRVDSGAFVSQLQQQMLKDKRLLEQQLQRGQISPEKFANAVNSLLKSVLKKASKVLTSDEFEHTFGFQYPSQEAILLDPKLAAASSKAK